MQITAKSAMIQQVFTVDILLVDPESDDKNDEQEDSPTFLVYG